MKPLLSLSIVLAILITGAIFVLIPSKTFAAGVNLIQNPGFEKAETTDPSRPAS